MTQKKAGGRHARRRAAMVDRVDAEFARIDAQAREGVIVVACEHCGLEQTEERIIDWSFLPDPLDQAMHIPACVACGHTIAVYVREPAPVLDSPVRRGAAGSSPES